MTAFLSVEFAHQQPLVLHASEAKILSIMLVLVRDVLVLLRTVFIVPTRILFVLLALMDLPWVIMEPVQLHVKLPIPLTQPWENVLVLLEPIKQMENV